MGSSGACSWGAAGPKSFSGCLEGTEEPSVKAWQLGGWGSWNPGKSSGTVAPGLPLLCWEAASLPGISSGAGAGRPGGGGSQARPELGSQYKGPPGGWGLEDAWPWSRRPRDGAQATLCRALGIPYISGPALGPSRLPPPPALPSRPTPLAPQLWLQVEHTLHLLPAPPPGAPGLHCPAGQLDSRQLEASVRGLVIYCPASSFFQ